MRKGGGPASASPGRISRAQILHSVAAGFLGSLAFMFLFPGGSITTLMHEVMGLPGPGAGIGMVYGPFICMVAFIAWDRMRQRWTVLLTCASFGVFHSVLAQVVYGSVKTAGTIGPLHLRILAVVVLGLVLEAAFEGMKGLREHFRLPLAAIPASIAIMSFYWLAIFPNSPKGPVDPADIPVLLAVTVLGAAAIGGLLAMALNRVLPKAR